MTRGVYASMWMLVISGCGSGGSTHPPDAAGAASIAIDNVTVGGAACVPTVGCDCSAQTGDMINFSIDAADDHGIAQVGYQIAFTGAAPVAANAPQAGNTAHQPFTFVVPGTADAQTAQLTAQATDGSGGTLDATPLALCITRRAIAPTVAWTDGTTVYLRVWDGTAWQELGGSGSGIGGGDGEAVALGPDGNPVVAWLHRNVNNTTDVYMKHWNGTTWEELGGSASSGGVSNVGMSSVIGAQDPGVAIDSTGRIYVSWKFAETPNNACCNLYVYVKRWNGTAWEELAGSATGTGINVTSDGSAPSIRIDAMDRPVVVWNEEGANTGVSGCAVWLRRWNGTAWEELAASASGSGVEPSGSNGDPAVAIGRDGNPVVAWNSATDSGGFAVRRFDGTQWNSLGALTSNGSCEAGWGMSVAIDAADHPTIAFADVFTSSAVTVSQWNGTNWTALPANGISEPASIAADAAGVLVAWPTGSGSLQTVNVARWDGSAWQTFPSPGNGWGPQLATR